MYLTEKEIFSQYSALNKTYDYLKKRSNEILNFCNSHKFESVTFIGCGSGYCLCQSGEISAKLNLGLPANSIAAGDLMINFSQYAKLLKNTLLIVPSRSGSTSEVIMAVEMTKKKFNTPCIAISAVEGSRLSEMADLSLDMPWTFDESVCQTRTVTNLYMADLLLLGIIAQDNILVEEINKALLNGKDYMNKYTGILKGIAENHDWNHAVVLADSELQGIASEGAIAFAEIPQIQANYYHILDVRHGPAVLIGEKTLVIMACSPDGVSYQTDLIKELKDKGALVVTVSSQDENIWDSDFNITIPNFSKYGVTGIPFIFVPQVIAYYKALARGINPDVPQGLDAWIKL